MSGKKTVRLLPVVDLVVVGRGVRVLMPGEYILGSEVPEERRHLVEDVWLNQRGAITAIVFRVVDQKRGARSPKSDQHGVVARGQQIAGVMLDVSCVSLPLDARCGRGKTG